MAGTRDHTTRAPSFTGINRQEALRWARRLGCRVEPVRRTAEVRVVHDGIGRSIRINARRKDAGRELTTFLHRVVTIGEGKKTVSAGPCSHVLKARLASRESGSSETKLDDRVDQERRSTRPN